MKNKVEFLVTLRQNLRFSKILRAWDLEPWHESGKDFASECIELYSFKYLSLTTFKSPLELTRSPTEEVIKQSHWPIPSYT